MHFLCKIKFTKIGLEEILNIITSSIDYILNFGMSNSLSALLFGTSCCAKSLQNMTFQDLNIKEYGLQTLNAQAKDADLLIITGLINVKTAPHLVNLYNKMPKPAYVIVLGDCACDGGIFSQEYDKNIDIETLLPVDIHLKGCPIEAERFKEALIQLKNKIKNTYIKEEKNAQNTTIEPDTDISNTLKEPENRQLEALNI